MLQYLIPKEERSRMIHTGYKYFQVFSCVDFFLNKKTSFKLSPSILGGN